MTTSVDRQYHFSQEQRARLGQVYNLILQWRQERLANQTKQANQNAPASDLHIEEDADAGEKIRSGQIQAGY